MSRSYSRPRQFQGVSQNAPFGKRPGGANIRAGIGSLIRTLEVPEAKAIINASEVAVSNLKPVASYNWKDARSPTIIVPGCPMLWSEREPPYTVPPDSGIAYIDQNAARCLPSMSPLEPLFLALDVMAPKYDLASVDLVTDRNNLRKLHRWVTNNTDKDFRIDAQLLGKETVTFRRWEMRNTQGGTKSRGFGHSFEREVTQVPPGCDGSTSHHRIVEYDFGGLRILCRFEVDACNLGSASSPDDLDDLLRGFSQTDLTSPSQPISIRKGPGKVSKIQVVRAGKFVPQSSIMELKSRSTKGGIHWKEIWPQAFFSSTSTVVVGRHEQGKFVSVERKSLEEMRSGCAGDMEVGLGQLIQVLKEIRTIVISKGRGHGVTLICERGQRGRIEVYQRSSGDPAISPELLSKYEG